MEFVFLALLIATGIVAHFVITRLYALASSGARRPVVYILAVLAVLISYAALCAAAPSPFIPGIFYLFGVALLIDYALLLGRERRRYRRWQSQTPDTSVAARQVLRIAGPLMALLLVLNAGALIATRGGITIGSASPTPAPQPSFVPRPSQALTGRPLTISPNGATSNGSPRTFNFDLIVDLNPLTKLTTAPILDPAKPFEWSLTAGEDFSPLHPLFAISRGTGLSSTISVSLPCAVAASNPATISLTVTQGTATFPRVQALVRTVAGNDCPQVSGISLKSAAAGPDTSAVTISATVNVAKTNGTLAWTLTELRSGKATQLTAGAASQVATGQGAGLELTIPCAVTLDNTASLLVDLRDGSGPIGWIRLPSPSSIMPVGVCGK